jgi:hypothetical protein
MSPHPITPLPPPEDRASVSAVSEKYQLPVSTVYDMLDAGTLPSWRIGRLKRCTSWTSVRAFFGDRAPDPPTLDA